MAKTFTKKTSFKKKYTNKKKNSILTFIVEIFASAFGIIALFFSFMLMRNNIFGMLKM